MTPTGTAGPSLKTRWDAADILSRLSANGGIGFVFHATDRETVGFAYESPDISDEALWRQRPFIGSPVFFGNRLIGAHIISPLPPELWATGHEGIRRFRTHGYTPSLSLAGEAGLTHVGLGALVPFATEYGKFSRADFKGSLTTGHAATVATIRQQAESLGRLLEFDPVAQTYAVFGAAGSIGSNVARWFAECGVAGLLLVDVRKRLAQVRLLADELHKKHRGLQVGLFDAGDTAEMPCFDLGIVATNSAHCWMDERLIRKAPIWIDDSHPRAASAELEQTTADSTLYLECFLRGPPGLCQVFPFRLPTSRDCYSCFAEVFTCWRLGMTADFVIGPATLDQIAFIDGQLRQQGFVPGPPTSKGGGEISHARIETMREIIRRRRGG